MVVRACKVIQISKKLLHNCACFTQINHHFSSFFYGSGIKILSSLSKYLTEVDRIGKWSSVYVLITLKKKSLPKTSGFTIREGRLNVSRCLLFGALLPEMETVLNQSGVVICSR